MRKKVFLYFGRFVFVVLEIQNLIGTHCCDSFCFFFGF